MDACDDSAAGLCLAVGATRPFEHMAQGEHSAEASWMTLSVFWMRKRVMICTRSYSLRICWLCSAIVAGQARRNRSCAKLCRTNEWDGEVGRTHVEELARASRCSVQPRPSTRLSSAWVLFWSRTTTVRDHVGSEENRHTGPPTTKALEHTRPRMESSQRTCSA
nr:hypothetical protein CFP56_36181 [Quercus suber]